MDGIKIQEVVVLEEAQWQLETVYLSLDNLLRKIHPELHEFLKISQAKESVRKALCDLIIAKHLQRKKKD